MVQKKRYWYYRIGAIVFQEGGLWEDGLWEGGLWEDGLREGGLLEIPVLAWIKSLGDKYTQQLFERK
ncbi:18113_t:CDS:2, partial [Gigaspora rosea]